MPRRRREENDIDPEDRFVDEDARPAPPLRPIKMDGWTLYPDVYLGDEYDHVDDASTELPRVIDWCNEKLALMVESKYLAQREAERAEARAYFKLRTPEGWVEAGMPGKLTEVALKHAVTLDEVVIKAHEDVAVFLRWVSRFERILSALNNKLDLVRTSESTRRKTQYSG